MLDTLMLSRMQFAANISFHILFPAITIALSWVLFYFKFRFHLSNEPVWMRAYRFWVRVFALSFALGVVSGVAMSFQFGTNWPGYMETVGNIAGPLLGYEVLTAFFLEATFLGIMLFGIKRVPPWMHTLATGVVAIGTSLSAFWIIALISWMHTPQGFEMRDGVAYPVDWLAIIFNPSMPYRLIHMLLASGLTAAFLVAGISAYRMLQGDHKKAPQVTFKTGVVLGAVLIPLQIFLGDLHGLNTLEHQPQKVAAMEGLWQTKAGAPLLLFAIPDENNRENHFEIGIPKLASLILTHELDGEVQGLNDFQPQHPPMAPVFFGFRVMVGVGVLMLIFSWWGAWQIYRSRTLSSRYSGLYSPLYLKIMVAMTFSGWVATLAGWYVTEIGRQPYLVTGLLTTADAVTQIPSSKVGVTLATYVTLYTVLLIAYIKTLMVMAREAVAIEEDLKYVDDTQSAFAQTGAGPSQEVRA